MTPGGPVNANPLIRQPDPGEGFPLVLQLARLYKFSELSDAATILYVR